MQQTTSPGMMAEINVTPLVDVMLVLLVIFMLVTPAITQKISQKIAPSPPIEEKTEPHKLIVQAGDTFQLDGQMISPAELKQHLSLAIKADSEYTVQVFGEPEASYQSFTQAMAIANNAGVENLSLASN
jgi:biopolymer transport protein ExbD